jgi:CheY-like chemotaxis protein
MSNRPALPARKTRILIVDDLKAATAMWRTLLERTGVYAVKEENRSALAVRTAREFHPDLIVLDVNMPELDGSDVARALAREHTLRTTPIVFMTSLISEEEAAQGKKIEGYPCVAKPGTIAGLIETIEKHLTPAPHRARATPPLGMAA